MEDPANTLRDALEAFRHDEAMERVRRWRGVDGADSEAVVAARHARLGRTSEVADLLATAARSSTLEAPDLAALRAHLARAAADVVLAPARDALEAAVQAPVVLRRGLASIEEAVDALGHEDDERARHAAAALADRAEGVAHGLIEPRRGSNEAGLAIMKGGAPPPDAGPDADALLASAESLLDATDDLVHEVRAHLVGGRASLAELVTALRFDEPSAGLPARDRFRRLAAGVSGLGFGGDLASRVRIAGAHPFPTPRTRLVIARAPRDVRIFTSEVERGLTSELAGAEALGRALAHALCSPALPVEHRRPLGGTVARSFGVLVAQLLADRVHLSRSRQLAGNAAERIRRAAAASLVLLCRARAAVVVARARGRTVDGLTEEGGAALERALGVVVPLEYARLAVVTPAAHGPRHRATVHALAIAWQLRETFDEDYFDNPKAAEPLRAAAARGGLLSVEAFADELGATPDLAARRLAELFG